MASTIRVVRKAYGKFTKEHCIVQFDKSLRLDYEVWASLNLEKLYKKHGRENIEIRE